MADEAAVSSKLRLAAMLRGRDRDRVLRALARLIVEKENEEARINAVRDMARGYGRKR